MVSQLRIKEIIDSAIVDSLKKRPAKSPDRLLEIYLKYIVE